MGQHRRHSNFNRTQDWECDILLERDDSIDSNRSYFFTRELSLYEGLIAGEESVYYRVGESGMEQTKSN